MSAGVQPIPVETWLVQVQQSICQDDMAEAPGRARDNSAMGGSGLLPLQLHPQDEGAQTVSTTAHKRGPDLALSTPKQPSPGHDPVVELRHAEPTLARPRIQSRCERSGHPFATGAPLPSDRSRPAESDVEEFVRKPRRKTRQDRYDAKKRLSSDKAQGHNQNDDDRQVGRKSRRKIGNCCGKEVMHNFASETIFRDNLIMKPCVIENHPIETTHTPREKRVADLKSHDFDLTNRGIRASRFSTTQSDLENRRDVMFPAHPQQRPEHHVPPTGKKRTRSTSFFGRWHPGVGVHRTGPDGSPADAAMPLTNTSTYRSHVHEPSLGRISPHVRNLSREDSLPLQERSTYPYPDAMCEPQSHNNALSHMDPLLQDMTCHNAARLPEALTGASNPHGEFAKTVELTSRVLRPTRAGKSGRYMAEEQPLHPATHQPTNNTTVFDTKPRYRRGDSVSSDALRPCRRNTATFGAHNTVFKDSSGTCMDLGSGLVLNLGRLRNRSLYRTDRIHTADYRTMKAMASQQQYTRHLPPTTAERRCVSVRKRGRDFDVEEGAEG